MDSVTPVAMLETASPCRGAVAGCGRLSWPWRGALEMTRCPRCCRMARWQRQWSIRCKKKLGRAGQWISPASRSKHFLHPVAPI